MSPLFFLVWLCWGCVLTWHLAVRRVSPRSLAPFIFFWMAALLLSYFPD